MGVKRLKEPKLPPPLKGVKIVDVGVWHAGPGGAAILADLGADVIKIEDLKGDPERNYGALGTVKVIPVETVNKPKTAWNLLHELTNRGKLGICADLRQEEGRKILHALVKDADIFVTSLQEDSKPRMGIDYETLREINPKLIYVSFTGFGPKGPEKDAKGFDPMVQGYSGLGFVTGPEVPKVIQIIFGDQMASIAVSHAMLAALVARDRQGHGQRIDVSLYGALLWLNQANVLGTSVTGVNTNQAWDRTINPPIRNTWKCKDGKWLIGTNHPDSVYWERLCKAMELDHLLTDPRYAAFEDREQRYRELVPIFDEKFLTKTRDEWMAIFRKHDMMFQIVQDLHQVINDPQALENDYLVEVDHPIVGKQRWPGYPYSFSKNSTVQAVAPELGEHTVEVLTKLGYGPGDIAALRAKKIIN